MATLPTEFADLEPFADWCLAVRGRALRQAARELDGRAAGVLRRRLPPARGGDRRTSTGSTLDALPDDATPPAVALLLAGQRVVPGRGVAPAARARQRRREHGRRSSNPPSDARADGRDGAAAGGTGDASGDARRRVRRPRSPPTPTRSRPSSRTTSRRWRGACGRATGALSDPRPQPAGDGDDRGARADGGVPSPREQHRADGRHRRRARRAAVPDRRVLRRSRRACRPDARSRRSAPTRDGG